MNSPMKQRANILAACAGLSLALAAPWAHADDDDRRSATPPLPLYAQECSACHLAFPARMLGVDSWQRLMDNLPKHFGSDASLDPTSTATITTWLKANAGTDRHVREAPPQDRITRSAWFVREHREVRAATWSLPAVKSAANCAACHIGAEKGDFDEHRIRIPR
jgi:hypothetical protein